MFGRSIPTIGVDDAAAQARAGHDAVNVRGGVIARGRAGLPFARDRKDAA